MAVPKIKVGIDIEEVKKFRSKPPVRNNISFYNSIFTKSELTYCLKYSDPYPHLAGVYAAKESVVKSFSKPIKMIDIHIIQDVSGKPRAIIHSGHKTINANISISHTQSLAIAVAVVLS
jgi:phosphopantetheine--protein transferase-like protein